MRLQERPPLEPDMSMADFKKLLHGQMRDTLLKQYADYLEAVQMSDDPEVKRKCVAMHIQTIGAEHREKVDPGANLPVFNFTFSSTGMTASNTQPVIEVQASADLATFDMTMLNPAARVALNRDVDFGGDEC